MEYLIVTAADKGGPYEPCIMQQREEHGDNCLALLVPSRGSWHENTKIKPAAIREALEKSDVVLWIDADCYFNPPDKLPEGNWDVCIFDNIHPKHKLKISAAFLLFRNTYETKKFLQMWELLNKRAKKDHPALMKTIRAMQGRVRIQNKTSWIAGRHTLSKYFPERGVHHG
jgi:hypothetical protein